MEACAKLLGVYGAPFCTDKSSSPFRYAATIALGGMAIACVFAAVAFASATGREFKSFVVAPAVVAVIAAFLVAAVALVHYVPVQSSGSWCREVELCDCFVRNSKMEAPQAAALALTAKHYRKNLRRRRKGPFQS